MPCERRYASARPGFPERNSPVKRKRRQLAAVRRESDRSDRTAVARELRHAARFRPGVPELNSPVDRPRRQETSQTARTKFSKSKDTTVPKYACLWAQWPPRIATLPLALH